MESKLPVYRNRLSSPDGLTARKEERRTAIRRERRCNSLNPRHNKSVRLHRASKTTFAREFLPKEAGVVRFVNADLIASGLSPLRPELAALAGGRILLAELDRLARARVDIAFETTLSSFLRGNS